jgi:hypothetical protein
MHFLALPVAAVPGLDKGLIKKAREIIHMPIRSQNHVAAASAITAIRSAFRHKFLAPETHAPAAAIARLRKHFDSIDEHVSEMFNRKSLNR